MSYEPIGASDTGWAGKTAEAIRSLGREPGSLAVLPVGSVEQHGHHLPVGTDTILADAVASEGARRASDRVPLLVLPPVWSGYSPHHLPFGGTLSLSFETMLHLVEDLAESALGNEFDAFVFVNGHGGNSPLVSAATSTVGVDHPEVEVLGLTYFNLATSFIDEIRESGTGGMSHGGEFETSLMLHLRPDLVDMERAAAPYLDEPYDHGVSDMMAGASLSVYRSFDEYSQTGAIGDPAVANAEKGAELFDRLGDELADLFLEVHERNR